MRVKRLKKANKILTFFHYNYGYNSPYLLLLDGTFCQAALQGKINLREQMPKYLAEETEMFVTQCVLNELEQLGTGVYGALAIARQFAIASCPHKPLRTASECIAHLARRSKRQEGEKKENPKYFIATQDDELLEKLRLLGGIPLISIRWNAILLEKPSKESHEGIARTTSEVENVKKIKAETFGELETVKRIKRKPKGPNPLSCKKKKGMKNKSHNAMAENDKKPNKKRKRVRKKLAVG